MAHYHFIISAFNYSFLPEKAINRGSEEGGAERVVATREYNIETISPPAQEKKGGQRSAADVLTASETSEKAAPGESKEKKEKEKKEAKKTAKRLKKAARRVERTLFNEKSLENYIGEVEQGLRDADKSGLKKFIEEGINYTGSYRDLNDKFCTILGKPGLAAGEQMKYAAALQLYLVGYLDHPVFEGKSGRRAIDGKIGNYTSCVLAVWWDQERAIKMEQKDRFLNPAVYGRPIDIDIAYKGTDKRLREAIVSLSDELSKDQREISFAPDELEGEKPGYARKTPGQVLKETKSLAKAGEQVRFQTEGGKRIEVRYTKNKEYEIALADSGKVIGHGDLPYIESQIPEIFSLYPAEPVREEPQVTVASAAEEEQ